MIFMKFCTWQDSCVIMPCALFCSDMIPYNGATLNPFSIKFELRRKSRSWYGPQVSSYSQQTSYLITYAVCANMVSLSHLCWWGFFVFWEFHHHRALNSLLKIHWCSNSIPLLLLFLAATKQLYEWYFLSVCPSVRLSVRLSVCPSVRLSVCHTFLTMFPSSYHHEIFRSYHIGPG